MKNIFKILIALCVCAGIYIPMYAGTITATGNLQKTENQTISTAAVEIKDCDGNVVRTIPATSTTQAKYTPYPNNGQTIRFVVIRKQNPEVTVRTFDYSINDINYQTSNGSFSKELTDVNITPSRYNYNVKVYVLPETSPASEREYTLSSSGGAFPIGSIIAYLGNSGTVAALEESGWFKCDGRLISNLGALTADEITALTNTLGGSSNLPDLRGNFLRGLDESRGYDDDAGSRTGGESSTGVRSYQVNQIQSHSHTGSADAGGNHNHGGTTGSASRNFAHDTQGGISSGGSATLANNSYADHTHDIPWSGTHTHNLTINNAGGAETRPENIAVYWLIRGR